MSMVCPAFLYYKSSYRYIAYLFNVDLQLAITYVRKHSCATYSKYSENISKLRFKLINRCVIYCWYTPQYLGTIVVEYSR